MCCTIEGKSSLARLGLANHQTGGWVDAGFCGILTLEMTNVMCKPIELYAGISRLFNWCSLRWNMRRYRIG